MAEQLNNVKLVLIDTCGHLAPLERPEEVNTAFDEWLG